MIEETLKTDFYIRLNSEADVPTALAAFYRQDTITEVDPETGETTEVPDGDPYLVMNTADYAIDVVGIISEPTGNILTDAEGNEYPERVPVSGWHINIRLIGNNRREDVESLDTIYGVTPNSPSRVWL